MFEETRVEALNYIVNHNGLLLNIPFPEKHPYKELLPLNEKFKKYIIGTNPPISYLLDNPVIIQNNINHLINPGQNVNNINKPKIPFYHGNRDCSLWKIASENLIPDIVNPINRLDVRNQLIDFLNENAINYFDIINECQREQYNANDDNLFNILTDETGLHHILAQVETPILIFNTSSTFSNTGLLINNGNFSPRNKSFDFFLWVLMELNFEIDFSFSPDFDWISIQDVNPISTASKVIFYLRINNVICLVITGASPSPASRNLANNTLYINYINQIHNGYLNTILDFKKYIFRNAIQENYELLWLLNG